MSVPVWNMAMPVGSGSEKMLSVHGRLLDPRDHSVQVRPRLWANAQGSIFGSEVAKPMLAPKRMTVSLVPVKSWPHREPGNKRPQPQGLLIIFDNGFLLLFVA